LPKAKITALGCYTPPRVLTNFELEQMVQTSNQWILERTGISERHIADADVATSDLAANAAKHVGAQEAEEEAAAPWPPTVGREMFAEKPKASIFGWLGWAAAAAACVALIANIWHTRVASPEVSQLPPTPIPSPRALTPQEQFAAFESSTPNLVRANWAPGNVKDIRGVTGEVVWSDAKQAGYIRISGLPKNDPGREQYQLWIFDENQDPKTPIDGGVFDASSDGEIVIPIDAKIKVKNPKVFAITVERPGGVVVSKQEKVAALAKVET